MANLTLELNIYSAKDLENVNIITKMDAYAVVSIRGDETLKNQKLKTPIDRSGGSNPTWNHAVKFSVNDRLARDGGLVLVVKLVCDRVLGDKEIGEVNVPVLELLGSNPPSPSSNGEGNCNGMKFVTYQVRTPSGRGKGSLTFAYRFDSDSVKPDLQVPPVYPNPVKSELPSPVYPPPPLDSGIPSLPTSPLIGYPPLAQPNPGQPGSLYPDLGKLSEPVKLSEPAAAYPPPPPPGPSFDPPPYYSAPPLQPYVYPPPPADKPGHAYHHAPPPQAYNAYAPPPPPPGNYGYGYPTVHPGYGYGYPMSETVRPPKKNKAGLGVGAGLLGGALGGLLIGDIITDMGFDF